MSRYIALEINSHFPPKRVIVHSSEGILVMGELSNFCFPISINTSVSTNIADFSKHFCSRFEQAKKHT
jgi:hypothetical protein